MRTRVALAGLLTLMPMVASAARKPIAYSAEAVTVMEGVTSHRHEWSDGVRWKSESADGTSGYYEDQEKRLAWQWGRGYDCLQIALEAASGDAAPKEEEMGRETVDGHPTRKVKVTYTFDQQGVGRATRVDYQWRASDLQGLAIQTRAADGSRETHLRHIVLGPPDPARLAFPSPQCRYDAAADTTRYAAQPPGGFRTVSFFDAGCKQFVPLPLEMSIPSDYAIRDGRPRGCFWGRAEDLDRVLATPSQVDFTAIRHGVFWCRASDDAGFDPVQRRFVSAQGPQENWPAALAALGIRDVAVTPHTAGGIDTLRVSGTLAGKHVYLLYLGFGDSPAVLISYTPAGSGGPEDDAEWRRFLESLRAAR